MGDVSSFIMSDTLVLKDGRPDRLKGLKGLKGLLAIALVALPFLLLATPAQAEGPWHHHHHHHHCHH